MIAAVAYGFRPAAAFFKHLPSDPTQATYPISSNSTASSAGG
jgi:hypothetical protein